MTWEVIISVVLLILWPFVIRSAIKNRQEKKPLKGLAWPFKGGDR
jgi:hypothetical protein